MKLRINSTRHRLCPRKSIKFDDIRIGDVLMFPDSPGCANHVFMRIWTVNDYESRDGQLDKFTLIRLDDGNYPGNKNITRSMAGQSYTLSRLMMEEDIYVPVRYHASGYLEDEA